MIQTVLSVRYVKVEFPTLRGVLQASASTSLAPRLCTTSGASCQHDARSPLTSFNPLYTIARQMNEMIRAMRQRMQMIF